MSTPTAYLRLKTDDAPKVGPRSTGTLTYAILRDEDGLDCHLVILANSGGGYFSNEVVAYSGIRQCLEGVNLNKPIPGKLFKEAFHGRSANNAGFLVAILCHEGLLERAPGIAHQYLIAGDWQAWKSRWQAQAGEAYVPPSKCAAPAVAITLEQPPARSRKGRKDLGDKQHPSGTGHAAAP